MAERYGPLLASFVDRRDPNNAIITWGGVGQLGGIEQAEVTKVRGQMNRGRFTLLPAPGWDGLVREGRIVSLYQQNAVSDAAGRGLYREMGSFLVQSARERLLKDGRQVVDVRGLGIEHLLTKYKIWRAVGKETVYATQLTANARGPWVTHLAEGMPHGNESAALESDANFLEGDEIRIRMDTGDWFLSHIRNADPSGVGPGVVQLTSRIPGDATDGNDVEGRRARLEVGNLTGFAVGQRVAVRQNDNEVHITLVREVDLAESVVVLEEGLPVAADEGRAVWVYDYSEPAEDDVEQILVWAPGWTVELPAGVHGTGRGTAHVPAGDSVWETLEAAAAQTGEFFRIAGLSGGFAPRRRLRWLGSADSSGMVLYLRSSSADVAADTENVDRGVIHSIERERESDLITRCYPMSGDGRIDLEYCSEEALLRAAVEGFAVVISDDLFQPDYVEYGPGVGEHGVLEGTIRFGNVSLPKRASLKELNAAADAMLAQAMTAILEAQAREFWRAEVHCHRALYPGQSVQIVNQAMEPKVSGTYYVLEVTERYSSSGPTRGVIMSSVLLSREQQLRPTAVVKLGREMKTNQQAARRVVAATEGAAGATVVSGGGGGGTPGPHEHGEFLRVDGTRALVGDLAVADGKRVDGVDVSAHAADPAAHHAPVTAGDGSLLVSGQAVRVADGFAGEGLLLAGGVARVGVAVGQGTQIAGDVVGVAVEPAGGLMVAALGVGVKRPVNSGVKASTAGLEIVPLAVGAKTVNGVVGDGHSHAGLAFADGKVNPGEILKTDVNGDARTRWFSADKLRAPILESESGPVTVDPVDGVMNVDGDVVLTGAGRAIRSAVGQGLRIAPAGRLMLGPGDGVVELGPGTTLKTQHWASGFLGVGWGGTYEGDWDVRRLHADELIVQTFIADAARVRVGQLWVTPGAALLAEAFVIPGVGGSQTLVVEDAPASGLANMPVFDAGDWVMIQVSDRSGGGLRHGLAWGQVSGYVDGPGAGQQSWTFTCRSTGAAGQMAAGGSEVLGFAKSGAGWIQANATDAVGAPWLGMSMWRGDNPYSDGNRVHFLRIGQLRGVTGVWEQGFWVGQAGARRLKWSELGPEIHGARQSLYAGDGAQARVVAADVRLYRDASNYVTLVPNGDGVATNVISSGSGYWGQIDESVDAPAAADWVANGLNSSGQLSVQLTDPSVWGAVASVTVRAVVAGVGFSSDSVRVYGQVVAGDEVTPLTGEELLATLASNVTTTVTKALRADPSATQAMWNGARLRLRWDYSINSAKEAIRLDPQVPSVAVGMGLPTGMNTGGDGFWVGAEGGLYQMRLGKAAGVGLRWDGAALGIRNSANQDVIVMRSDGTSEFARAMTFGPEGGFWQGPGSFGAPGTGLKLWRDAGGVGRLSTFNGGLEQMTLNSLGQLVAGAGGVVLDRSGLRFVNSLLEGAPGHPSAVRFYSGASGADYVNLHGYGGGLRMATVRAGSYENELVLSHGAGALGSNLYGMFTKGVELHVREGAGGAATLMFMQPGEVAITFANGVGRLAVAGGLSVAAPGTPAAGVIRLVGRATGVGVPPTDGVTTTADVYLVAAAGVQTLYCRFSNGVTRALASSA